MLTMTTNPSLTSGSGPASKEKIRRVRTLTEEALEQGNFTQDQLQCVHANGGEYKCEYSDFLREFARRRTTAAASSSPIPTMPAEDEWFELTVDNNIDPMSVVTSAGFDATKWEYLGPPFSGVKNYRVKLIALGYVRNLDEAKAAAKLKNPKYQLLEGQAREAFSAICTAASGAPTSTGLSAISVATGCGLSSSKTSSRILGCFALLNSWTLGPSCVFCMRAFVFV